MIKQILIAVSLLALSACSTTKTVAKTTGTVAKTTGKVASTSGKVVYKTTKGTVNAIGDVADRSAPAPENVDKVGSKANMGEAVLTPLSDINVRKTDIPEELLALKSPYEVIRDRSCAGLVREIEKFNGVLGEDYAQSPAVKDKDGMSFEEGSVSAVSSLAGSLIPFRGLVRTATGATKYERELRAQYNKGIARRAYLRGIWDSKGC